MIESYDPYANAVAEKVNGIIKNEFLLGHHNIEISTMKHLVSESIKIYNEQRPHYLCQMLTPQQMHNQNKMKIKTYKTKNSSKTSFAAV